MPGPRDSVSERRGDDRDNPSHVPIVAPQMSEAAEEEDAEEEEAPTERAPLLPSRSSNARSGLKSTPARQEEEEERQKKLRRSGFSFASVASTIASHVPRAHVRNEDGSSSSSVLHVLCAVIFLASCSGGFIELPMTRLIEDIICRQYYGVAAAETSSSSSSLVAVSRRDWESGRLGTDYLRLSRTQTIDESMCKEDAIQKKLAYLLAVNATLFAIVGCVAAFPWGLAADKIGRKPIVTLAMTGLLMSALIEMAVVYWHDAFPLTAIWLSSTGQLVGGGNAVLGAVIFTMVTDATREEDRAMAFLRTHISNLCGNLLSPSVAAVVMERTGSLWIAPIIGTSLFCLGTVIFIFLPETMVRKKEHTRAHSDSESDDDDRASPSSRVQEILHQLEEYVTMLTKSPSLVVLLTTLLLFAMPSSFSTLNFMNQYVSRRYGVTIAQTGYVQTVYGVASVVASLVVLPRLSRAMLSVSPSPSSSSSSSSPPSSPNKRRWRWSFSSEQARDLHLARASLLLLFLGSLTLALSPSLLPSFVLGLVLMALGAGASSLVKSLMSARVDPGHRSRLFSLAGIIDVLGSVYAQPLLASLFSLGLRLAAGGGGGGGDGNAVWIGLPYAGVAVLTALAGALLLFVRIIPRRVDDEGPGDDGREVTV
ncbi:major facilitator superfamily transporter [Xylariaceae sp. FL0594]|nr:major facilitator superfamily transporter [Xylariaceae sp. FL0594]